MALLESREAKKARRQVAVRMGKKKVQQYVHACRSMGEKYTDMAKQALSLGNQSQCDQYLMHRIQYGGQANKWESFLLKMEDLSLRGQMNEAMGGLVGGLQALTREIRDGVSAKEVTKAVTEINLTTARLEETENQFESAMDGMDISVGSPQDESSPVEIPVEMRGEVEKLRNELLDEVVVREKVGGASVPGSGKATDNRIDEGLKRLRKLKSRK